jgi:MFS family permease
MIREMFFGKTPSDFKIDSVIKAFIIAEMFLWSAWHAVAPIIAIFAANLPTGNIQTAASAYSVHLISRVVFELSSGRMLMGSGEKKKFFLTILGLSILSVGYLLFMASSTVIMFYIAYAITGVGMGIASPAKNSLFATHLDKDKEAMEWSLLDGVVFFCMAIASTTGGLIANYYGFQFLFGLSAIISTISILPYLLYIKRNKGVKFF